MSAINPIPSALPGTAESLDSEIEKLRVLLDSVTWLTGRSFGRAKPVARLIDPAKGTKRIEPLVYTAGQEYYSAYPNDALTAFSFWAVMSPRVAVDYKDHSTPKIFTAPVALIVWGNLSKIDPAKDYIYTEELLNQVIKKLNVSSRVRVTKIFDEDVRKVYQGFDIDPARLGLLMFPYFAFRIETEVDYRVNC